MGIVRLGLGLLLACAALVGEAQQVDRLRRLQVSVRFDGAAAGERVDQRVQVMDGGRATILTGQSRPVRQRQYIQTPAGVVSQEVTVVQETTAGFEVIPRLSGDRVSMEIVSSRTASTASGRVGEWFELGAIGGTRVWAKVETLD
jgi:hypothetical protein